MSGCGGCTMCCKVMKIPELEKPAGTWCIHCDKGKGCKIYETRPKPCSDFRCVWLIAEQAGNSIGATPEITAALRPDRCNVVINTTVSGKLALVLHVNPGTPHAWRQGEIGKLVAREQQKGTPIVVIVGTKAFGINVDPKEINFVENPDDQVQVQGATIGIAGD